MNDLLLQHKTRPLEIKTNQELLDFIPMIDSLLVINGPIEGPIVSIVINLIDEIE